ncbi:MAG: HD domain-containing protein [Eubacteriaceae bacterium]|nr:HD domain-containing protein [Eubacteriaceae bacterium]
MKRIIKVQKMLLEKINSYEGLGEDREYPLDFERIHMASGTGIGHMLAIIRGTDPELTSLACALHDFGRIVTGLQKDHANSAYQPLKEFLTEIGGFNDEEIEIIALAAKNHSSKDSVGTPLEEIVKDADVFDCWQYGIPMTRPEQLKRLEALIQELKPTV